MVIYRVVHEVFRWWWVCTMLPELLLLALNSVLLLNLLLDLLLSTYALFVDCLGLLWGQPELGSRRSWVYGRWACGSRACSGGVFLCCPISLLPFCLLCSLSALPFSGLPILSHLALPSLLLAFSPLGLVLCEPFGLLANGLLADVGELLWGHP